MLDKFPHIKPLFEKASWIEYICRFPGYDDDIDLEFSMHCREGRYEVAQIMVHAT